MEFDALSEYSGPTGPNLYICDPLYGTTLSTLDCEAAADQLPLGTIPITYNVNQPQYHYSLPIEVNVGACYVTIEIAGPTLPTRIGVCPSDFRDLAIWVINQCVTHSRGIGGFVTHGLEGLVNLYNHDVRNFYETSYPSTTAYFTVTVSGQYNRYFRPGNTDPSIALTLSAAEQTLSDKGRQGSSYSALHHLGAQYWQLQAENMRRTGTKDWWATNSLAIAVAADQMAYECDASLGSPSPVDCTQIEWNQLGPFSGSDTLAVGGPNQVSFFHSNTCYLAISASTPMLLSWDQVKTALGTLMSICIQNPTHPAQGGRAYYHQAVAGQAVAVSKEGKRRKRQADHTGLNALPPSANITLFEQREQWTNPTVEQKSCTWLAVTGGKPVNVCLPVSG